MFYQEVRSSVVSMLPTCKAEMKKVLSKIHQGLNSAIRFDLGEFESLLDLSAKDTPLFSGGNQVGPFMPYPTVWVEAKATAGNESADHGVLCVSSPLPPDGIFLHIYGASKFQKSQVHLVPGYIEFPVYKNMESKPSYVFAPGMDSDLQAQVSDMLNISAFILNMFMKLLQCKNIGVKEHVPSKSQQKKRTTVKPLISYNTLVINPMSKSSGGGASLGGENRVHLCRGHFKTFTADKPLFGSITGTYWWQPQARGRGKGIVVKDYKIER